MYNPVVARYCTALIIINNNYCIPAPHTIMIVVIIVITRLCINTYMTCVRVPDLVRVRSCVCVRTYGSRRRLRARNT